MLADRVSKARVLARQITTIPGVTGAYGNIISATDNTTRYQVQLSHKNETSQFGDQKIKHYTFTCKCCTADAHLHNCKGNERHTICYHCMAALIKSFNDKNIHISFHKDVFSAVRAKSFGGSLAKVVSAQGNGTLWAIVRKQERNFEENVNLIRGTREESEGID